MQKSTLRRVLAGLLVAVCVWCAIPTGALAELFKVQVTAKYANVYEKASTESKLLRKPPKGAIMTCAAVKGDWCLVKYDGTVGYALKSALTSRVETDKPEATPAPAETPAPEKPEATPVPEKPDTNPTPSPAPTQKPAEDKDESSSSNVTGLKVVTTQKCVFYKKASTSGGKWGTIPKNKTILCTKTSGIWARVEAGGVTGYVLKSVLKKVGTVTEDTGSSNSGGSSTGSSSSSSGSSSSARLICYMKEDCSLLSSSNSSASTVASLEQGDKVLVYQVKDGWGKVMTTKGTTGYVSASLLSKTRVNAAKQVVLADWFTSDIQKIYSVGTKATIVDVETGVSFNVRRKGGTKHADTETLTTADTKKMLKVYGGEWSWDRRAIWVVIDGVYYAASMNGMGHGEETDLSNNLEGHFCIHFLNSRTHGTNKECPLHQACVKKAYTTKP